MKQVARAQQMWYEIARRLRQRSVALGVFLLLWIGLVEPMACVLHCDIWELVATVNPSAAQHHAHGHHAHANQAGPDHGSPDGSGAAAHQGMQLCSNLYAPNNQHHQMPEVGPAPYHEMSLVTTTLLLFIVIGAWLPSIPAIPPPRLKYPPPLKPPIPCF